VKIVPGARSCQSTSELSGRVFETADAVIVGTQASIVRIGAANDVSVDYSGFGLTDKIAIVTGASQGIGRAIAVGLAKAGAHLVLAKHPEGRHEKIAQVQAEVEGLGRKALIVPTDVSRVDQVQAMVDQAKTAMGRVDILVNNAGWTGTTPALDVTEDEYDRTMASSLKSVFFACQAAARVMIPQGGGKIFVAGAFGIRGRQIGRSSPLAGVVARMGQAWSERQRRRAVHHRNGLSQGDSGSPRLQRVGDRSDAACGALEPAGRPCRRRAVPVERDVRHGRRPCAHGRRWMDHPLEREKETAGLREESSGATAARIGILPYQRCTEWRNNKAESAIGGANPIAAGL
jgi:NAD(P)-dependent dehydrogenase (short-subunit alcohol dehydrogenase family)